MATGGGERQWTPGSVSQVSNGAAAHSQGLLNKGAVGLNHSGHPQTSPSVMAQCERAGWLLPRRSRTSEGQGAVTVGGGPFPRLLRRYSNSSRCFLPRAGPWPFLREPFWGRSRCPRSCSFQVTPFCPSSLSRSESECMRAEEVGAGMGFRRAVGTNTSRSHTFTKVGRARTRAQSHETGGG